MICRLSCLLLAAALADGGVVVAGRAVAQTPPSTSEIVAYRGLHAAAIELGSDPRAITSPYGGTALIAAAHLGHADVVQALIMAKAPLDHVNNLGWTAVMEAVLLGDGGKRHQDTLKALADAGADIGIPDRNGVTALEHARRRDYAVMVALLSR